jgi:hypothetical protein
VRRLELAATILVLAGCTSSQTPSTPATEPGPTEPASDPLWTCPATVSGPADVRHLVDADLVVAPLFGRLRAEIELHLDATQHVACPTGDAVTSCAEGAYEGPLGTSVTFRAVSSAWVEVEGEYESEYSETTEDVTLTAETWSVVWHRTFWHGSGLDWPGTDDEAWTVSWRGTFLEDLPPDTAIAGRVRWDNTDSYPMTTVEWSSPDCAWLAVEAREGPDHRFELGGVQTSVDVVDDEGRAFGYLGAWETCLGQLDPESWQVIGPC